MLRFFLSEISTNFPGDVSVRGSEDDVTLEKIEDNFPDPGTNDDDHEEVRRELAVRGW